MSAEHRDGYNSPEMIKLRLLADYSLAILTAVFVFGIAKSIPGAVLAGWTVCMGTDKYINPMIWEAVKKLED